MGQKISKNGYVIQEKSLNGYLFLLKWPLKVGKGLRLELHIPVQTKCEYLREYNPLHFAVGYNVTHCNKMQWRLNCNKIIGTCQFELEVFLKGLQFLATTIDALEIKYR